MARLTGVKCIGFPVAVVVASYGILWPMIKTLFWAVFPRKEQRVNTELARIRVQQGCEQCEIYYKPLHTCGSPFRKQGRAMGCYCYMPLKASLKENCWAYDEDLDFGWPEAWNSFIHER